MDDNITQEEKDSILFKEPLCKYCQVKYLKANKNVTFDEYSKEEAADILYTHNYINVISPFKHHFAVCDNDGNPIKKDGKHIYPQPVKFQNYVDEFTDERRKYPNIFRNLMLLESHMNAIISNEILIHYNITSFESFETFVDSLKLNISNATKLNNDVKNNMLHEVEQFTRKLIRYKNIYVFLDRLSFSELITIYKMCKPNLKRKIFREFKDRKYTFGYDNTSAFDNFLRYAVQIRNCVCHSNSLATLTNYYRVETNEFRNSQSKRSIDKIIKILSSCTDAF